MSHALQIFFCDRLAQLCKRITHLGLPLREQAGALFGFAVSAVVQSGVPRDEVLRIAVDHVNVALAELQAGKVPQ
jgi:hypothetical protein